MLPRFLIFISVKIKMPFHKRKQFPKCINCGLKLFRNTYIVLDSVEGTFKRILTRWISPAQISLGDAACLRCYKLLLFYTPGDTPSQEQRVCYGCGRSLLAFRKDSKVLVRQPELDIIKEWTLPHLVDKIEKACYPCFNDAKRIAKNRGLYPTDTEAKNECIVYPELLEMEKENIARNTSQKSSSNPPNMGNKVKVEYIGPMTPQTKNAPITMSSSRKPLSNYQNADKNVSSLGNMSQELIDEHLDPPIPQTETEPAVAISSQAIISKESKASSSNPEVKTKYTEYPSAPQTEDSTDSRIISKRYKRIADTFIHNNLCIFTNCLNKKCVQVPMYLKKIVLLHCQVYIPLGAQVCKYHMKLGAWGDLEAPYSDFTGPQIDDMFNIMSSVDDFKI